MKDEVPTGTIIINKTGEFLSSISALDSSAGWIGNAFSYITGSLKDVTFNNHRSDQRPSVRKRLQEKLALVHGRKDDEQVRSK